MRLLALVGLSALLPGQAKYVTFGSGCAGSTSGPCASNNSNATSRTTFRRYGNDQMALEVRSVPQPVVLGFELFTQSLPAPVTTNAFIFLADTSGRPLATPAASATITVGTKPGWYRATFTPPVIVKQPFFLSWSPGNTQPLFRDPIVNRGTPSGHYKRTVAGPWTGPAKNRAWAWRVLCAGAAGVPALGVTGLPKLGTTFSVTLTNAKASTAALLITGVSNKLWGAFRLPLDLTGAGAPGCWLLVSFDLNVSLLTSTTGTAKISFPIPNNPVLGGLVFHNQWAVLDPPANALDLVFSNGGTATIGP
ncbi:MAG: hypothetical protein CMJ85_09755 [Planctomycetes bacterium]|nr:hypothetical protein [Planctomycetota bacterium]